MLQLRFAVCTMMRGIKLSGNMFRLVFGRLRNVIPETESEDSDPCGPISAGWRPRVVQELNRCLNCRTRTGIGRGRSAKRHEAKEGAGHMERSDSTSSRFKPQTLPAQ